MKWKGTEKLHYRDILSNKFDYPDLSLTLFWVVIVGSLKLEA